MEVPRPAPLPVSAPSTLIHHNPCAVRSLPACDPTSPRPGWHLCMARAVCIMCLPHKTRPPRCHAVMSCQPACRNSLQLFVLMAPLALRTYPIGVCNCNCSLGCSSYHTGTAWPYSTTGKGSRGVTPEVDAQGCSKEPSAGQGNDGPAACTAKEGLLRSAAAMATSLWIWQRVTRPAVRDSTAVTMQHAPA